MSITLTTYISGTKYDETQPVRITDGKPVFNWTKNEVNLVEPSSQGEVSKTGTIDQKSFTIRIGTSSVNHGGDSFVGNLINYTETTNAQQFKYNGNRLERGNTYYGQVRIVNILNETSSWKTFVFKYNNLPRAVGVELFPLNPTPTDSLEVLYTYVDEDNDVESNTKVRWYKNGVYQSQFDNAFVIDKSNVVLGDTWSADVLPHDGFEHGARESTLTATVSSESISVSDQIRILPENATENDILKLEVNYDSKPVTDNSIVRWYVNNVLQSEFNDKIFARPRVSIGDSVRAEFTASDGVIFDETMMTPTIAIQSSNFEIYDIKIDGRESPLAVPTLQPEISWDYYAPQNTIANYLSVKIGSFYGGEDIYSKTINKVNAKNLQVPANILQRGRDYYISLSMSENETFSDYKVSHFRTKGSRWKEFVDNSTGWTIECNFVFLNTSAPDFNKDTYHAIRILDGSRFAEVRIYSDRIGFFSDSLTLDETATNTTDFTKARSLIISGKNDDVRIYLDNEIYLNVSSAMTATTTEKRLSFGQPLGFVDTSNSFNIRYSSFNYTTSGELNPQDSSSYQDMAFYKIADLANQDIVALDKLTALSFDAANIGNVEFYYLLAANNFNESEGGTIYQYIRNNNKRYTTARRTFVPINSINTSLGKRYTAFNHSRGASIFRSYPLIGYNQSLDFSPNSQDSPQSNNWLLYSNVEKETTYFNSEGLVVDTSFDQIGGTYRTRTKDFFPGELESDCSDCPRYAVFTFEWESLEGGAYDYDDLKMYVCSYNSCDSFYFGEITTDSEGKSYYTIENRSGEDLLVTFYSSFGSSLLNHRYKFYQTDFNNNNAELLFDTGQNANLVGFCNANVLFENGRRLRVEQIVSPDTYVGISTQNGFHDTLDVNGRVRCLQTPCT